MFVDCTPTFWVRVWCLHSLTFTQRLGILRNPLSSFLAHELVALPVSQNMQKSHTLDHPGLNCSNLFCLEVLELDDAAAALVAAAALSAGALSCSCEVPRKSVGTCRKFVLICSGYFVHILLCVPLHANAHALDGWNSSLEKSGPTRWRPQLLLRLLLRLCQFFLALSQLCSSGALPFLCGFNCLLLLALCIPPQQAGLGNQGPGKQGPP